MGLRAQLTRLLRVARRAETFPPGVTPHRTLEGSSTLLPSGSGVVMLGTVPTSPPMELPQQRRRVLVRRRQQRNSSADYYCQSKQQQHCQCHTLISNMLIV